MKSSIPTLLVLLFLSGIGASLSAQEVFYYPDEAGHMHFTSSGITYFKDQLIVAEYGRHLDDAFLFSTARLKAIDRTGEVSMEIDYSADFTNYITLIGESQSALWFTLRSSTCPQANSQQHLHYMVDSTTQGSYRLPSNDPDQSEVHLFFDPETGIAASTDWSFTLYTTSGDYTLDNSEIFPTYNVVQTSRNRWLAQNDEQQWWIHWDAINQELTASSADVNTYDYDMYDFYAYNHVSGSGGYYIPVRRLYLDRYSSQTL